MIHVKKKNKLAILLFFSIPILYLNSCVSSERKHLKVFSRSNDVIVHFNQKSKYDSLVIKFNKNGSINELINYDNGWISDTYLEFYNNGQVKEIDVFNNGVLNGRKYSFYKSGIKCSELIYENGVTVGYGIEYYDTTANQHFLVLYNDSGHVYYLQEKDKHGNVIRTLGNR